MHVTDRVLTAYGLLLADQAALDMASAAAVPQAPTAQQVQVSYAYRYCSSQVCAVAALVWYEY